MSSSREDYYEPPDRFTENAAASFNYALVLAEELEASFLSTDHLLLGILKQKNSAGAKILDKFGVSFDRAKLALNSERQAKPRTIVQGEMQKKQFSETAKQTLRMSVGFAKDYHQEVCGTEHLLLAILQQKQGRAFNLLAEMNIDVPTLVSNVEEFLLRRSFKHLSQMDGETISLEEQGYDSVFRSDGSNPHYRSGSNFKRKPSSSVLETYSVDFTALAKKKKLDPVIGRQEQIQRTITILNRRLKNNPVLIGEPGVGKTAIVEGLSQRIVNENVPSSLIDKRILSLNLTGMIAGTKYRGEFEERINRVMAELKKTKNIILFIDEVHILVGAGAAEGALDASNILKPILARGDVQVIGATTTAEYTRHIEKDAALERRFQPVMVPETTVSETKAILKGVSQRYADFHQVEISDEVLEKTVQLTDRYINDRFFPDKAIDLLDEAAAYLRVSHKTRSDSVGQTHQRKVDSLRMKMQLAGYAEDYEQAADYKKQLSLMTQEHPSRKTTSEKVASRPALKIEHLAHVVSIWSGIPVQQVLKSEARFLLNLEQRLQKRIIGQNEAVEVVAKAIRRSRSGISSPKRPIGSFLFLGPTGVGKTELARVLAEEFYGRSDSLVKIDMSEFAARHTVARLIGAPPGYIGADQPGQLTEKIRRQPYSLVLLDEIEKAHPEVFNILLQILEDGCLTDAKGRKVNFANTIVILTSNLGASVLQKEVDLGFAISQQDEAQTLAKLHTSNEQKIHKQLKGFMQPEMINRFDKIVIFKSLSSKDVIKIVKVQLNELKSRLEEQKLGLVVNQAVIKYLAQGGYDNQNGIRSLRRLIQTELEDRIAESLLQGDIAVGDVISVGLNKKQQVTITKIVE